MNSILAKLRILQATCLVFGFWNEVSIKALREERGKLEKQARDLVDRAEKEGRDLTAEEEATFKDLHARDTEFKNRIERVEAIDAWRDELDQPADSPLDRTGNPGTTAPRDTVRGDTQAPANLEALRRGLDTWCRHRHGVEVSDQALQDARNAGFNPNAREIVIPLARNFNAVRRDIQNAMQSGSGAGSHLADLDFLGPIEESMLWFGPMLQVCDVIRTGHGNTIPWPTFNDTGNTGAYIDEATADSLQDPTTAATSFGAFKMTSKFCKVSYELLEDSEFSIVELLGRALGERLGRKLNTETTAGTSGAAKILGWAANAATGKTAASATAITADEVLDLEFSVDRAYRERGTFMCHDTTILALKKLKDSNGQYLWQRSLATREPDTFDGKPLMANNDVAQIATGNKTIGFGDFSKYKLRQVGEIRIKALVERWGDEDVTGFGAYIRVDGKILDAGTDPIKVLAQA